MKPAIHRRYVTTVIVVGIVSTLAVIGVVAVTLTGSSDDLSQPDGVAQFYTPWTGGVALAAVVGICAWGFVQARARTVDMPFASKTIGLVLLALGVMTLLDAAVGVSMGEASSLGVGIRAVLGLAWAFIGWNLTRRKPQPRR